MKENIKQILREGIDKNALGVLVSRPTQELIVMRGIPGSLNFKNILRGIGVFGMN
jgi:hypothetical protein